MDRVTAAIRGLTPALPGVEIEVSGGIGRPPLEKNATEHVFHHAKGIAETVGLTLREGGTGGGSDGNLTGALGIPTLDGLGVPGEGAHADHEHIEVDKIGERARAAHRSPDGACAVAGSRPAAPNAAGGLAVRAIYGVPPAKAFAGIGGSLPKAAPPVCGMGIRYGTAGMKATCHDTAANGRRSAAKHSFLATGRPYP